MKTTLFIVMTIFGLAGCSTAKQQVRQPPQAVSQVRQLSQIAPHVLWEAYKNAHVVRLSDRQLGTFPSGEYLGFGKGKTQVKIDSDSVRIGGDEFKLISGKFEHTTLGSISLYEIDGDKFIYCQYCYVHYLIKAPD